MLKRTPDKNDEINFGKVYGWALFHSARSWNFHSDSGCYDSLCRNRSIKRGNWRAIYSPSRELKECEGYEYTIKFFYTLPITRKVVDNLIPIIQIVDGLYLQSYNDLRAMTGGKWSAPIFNGTVEEIAQVVSPLKYTKKYMKMVMEIRGVRGVEFPRSNDSWTPYQLGVWLGENNKDIKDIKDFTHFTHPSVDALMR